jgi:hypothetical protein
LPNYSVTFEGGRTIIVWATDPESAKAKARKKYAAKKGRPGRIKKVS